MLSRLFYNAGQVLRATGHIMPAIKKTSSVAGKAGGKMAGIVGAKTIEGAAGAASKFSDIAAHFVTHSDEYAHGVGKAVGAVAGEVGITAKGVNNFMGAATGGFESKTLSKGLNNTVGKVKGGINKVLNTNLKTDYTDTRFMSLLKDSDDSLFFGKQATLLGGSLIVGAGAIMGAKDATIDRLNQQRGASYGSVSNAPVNTYAYQGASYADNAGATGDLALSLHRQRHSGIL